MERECLKNLIEWRNSRKRKPLVLMGARQVGFYASPVAPALCVRALDRALDLIENENGADT